MRALLAGERRGSLLQVLILIAVGCGTVASFLYAVIMHSQYRHTQLEVYRLCTVREAAEVKLRGLEGDDKTLQESLIQIEASSPRSVNEQRRVRAYTVKLAADVAYLATPVEDGCERLKP